MVARPAEAVAPCVRGTALGTDLAPLRLCLFDLDDTLLRTDDLESFRWPVEVGRVGGDYERRLAAEYASREDRAIYTQEDLLELAGRFPTLAWGIVTRAPAHYAHALLGLAYPNVPWTSVIAREQVRATKPEPDGVRRAMAEGEIEHGEEVLLVGDALVDVQAAYRAGCRSALETSAWGRPADADCFEALSRLPDAIVRGPAELAAILERPTHGLPELEYRLASGGDAERPTGRVEYIEHRLPDETDPSRTKVAVLGRYFTKASRLDERRGRHTLSEQIIGRKSATTFPETWIQALRTVLLTECYAKRALVTVIPAKAERIRRLEALLEQLARSHREQPVRDDREYVFAPDLLAFDARAVANKTANPGDRERNVRDHLHVVDPDRVRGEHVIVIDDVVTTGATLRWADRRLREAGATTVSPVALAKSVQR